MAKQLTENQQKFVEVLFEEAMGNPVEAKRLAGYSENTPTKAIMDSVAEEISEATRKFLATKGVVKAAYSLVNVLDNPTDLGVKEKLAAAKDILNRTGFQEAQEVKVTANQPLFILPPKEEGDDDDGMDSA